MFEKRNSWREANFIDNLGGYGDGGGGGRPEQMAESRAWAWDREGGGGEGEACAGQLAQVCVCRVSLECPRIRLPPVIITFVPVTITMGRPVGQDASEVVRNLERTSPG